MPSHAKSQDVSPGVQKIGSHGLPLQGNSENVISRWAADTWYEGILPVVPLSSGLLETNWDSFAHFYRESKSPQSSSVGKVFSTSLALGRLRTGSSLRIFPSRKTITRLANCAMSCS